jgi:hypothetical protein
MTRSSFNPRGGHSERSGTRNSGPDAENSSHLPPDLAQAQVTNTKDAEQDLLGQNEEIQQYRFRQKGKKNEGANVKRG